MVHFKTLQQVIDYLKREGVFVLDIEVRRGVFGNPYYILKTDKGDWPVSRDYTGMFYFNFFDFLLYHREKFGL